MTSYGSIDIIFLILVLGFAVQLRSEVGDTGADKTCIWKPQKYTDAFFM